MINESYYRSATLAKFGIHVESTRKKKEIRATNKGFGKNFIIYLNVRQQVKKFTSPFIYSLFLISGISLKY
ncbi:unnamed protein product [Cunninghamella blakesleeana]